MKTKALTIKAFALGLFAAFAITSCDKLAEATTIDLNVPESSVEFEVGGTQSVSAMKVSSATSESVVLLDRVIEMNFASLLKEKGYNFDAVKSFLLVNSTLELVAPTGFDMSAFKNVKLYFDDQTKLVAEAQTVNQQAGTVSIKIVNGELLDKLKSDKLHIILVGDKKPEQKVSLKLKNKFTAKVKLL